MAGTRIDCDVMQWCCIGRCATLQPPTLLCLIVGRKLSPMPPALPQSLYLLPPFVPTAHQSPSLRPQWHCLLDLQAGLPWGTLLGGPTNHAGYRGIADGRPPTIVGRCSAYLHGPL